MLTCAATCVPPAAASADSWHRTGSLAVKRTESTATVLPNGQVLVAGGFDTDPSHPFASVEAYDPLTGRWSAKASMSTAREDAVAALLTDGRVLVAGGSDGTHSLKTAQIYDPSTNTWGSPSNNMSAGRSSAMAQVLADGRVMVAGGYDDLGGGPQLTVDLYNPDSNSWSNTGMMGHARQLAGIAQLPDGKVLVAGGTDPTTAETWDPATNLWTPTNNDMGTPRFNSPFALTLLANGQPLFAGGGTPPQGGTDVYDPGTGQWSAVGSLATPRQFADAVLLRNGHVLAAGGLRNNSSPSLAVAETAELFNPATGKWSAAAKPPVPLTGNPASVLCDGRVLLAGGIDKYTGAFGSTSAAELYTPTLAHPLNGELLVNGNAEAGVAVDSNQAAVPPVGWVVTPNFTAGKYNPVYFPAPPGGGSNFFAGGPHTPSSRACQGVDVSQAAARIDAGLASVSLSADLGGYQTQLDNAGVTATFRGARGQAISQLVLQPVTETERGGVTKAIHRLASNKIPVGTRSIEVVISTTRFGLGYDDGYADNVSLRLKSTPLPLPKLTKFKLKPSSFKAGTKKGNGTTVSFTDSRAGTVRFTVARRSSGRKVGGRCVKKTKKNAAAKHCTRFVVVGSFARAAHLGGNVFHFAGLVSGKRLKAGKYRMTAVPRNAEGRAGKAASRSFTVVR